MSGPTATPTATAVQSVAEVLHKSMCSGVPNDLARCPHRRKYEIAAAALVASPEYAEAMAARERAAVVDLMTPWGPYEMGGFEGCTDQNPDYCACATDVQPTCRDCGQEIEPGQMAWSRQWPCYDTLPLDHKDQDWDVIAWHDDCDSAAATEQP